MRELVLFAIIHQVFVSPHALPFSCFPLGEVREIIQPWIIRRTTGDNRTFDYKEERERVIASRVPIEQFDYARPWATIIDISIISMILPKNDVTIVHFLYRNVILLLLDDGMVSRQ